MLSNARRLLAVSALLPTLAWGQGLGLRMDSSLRSPTAAELSDNASTVFLEADRVSGCTGATLEAEGSVRMRTRGRTVFADHAVYEPAGEVVTATGHVRVDRLGDVLEGSRVEMRLRDDSARAEAPRYFFRQLNARGEASRLTVDGKSRVLAEQATYTTCAPPGRDWYLKVRSLDLDRERDQGVARGVKVHFKDVPFLYMPYLDFPLSSARKSGFLAPTYGTTGKSGFEFTLPYYLNLAPNYDATLSPRFLAKRGLMLGSEFRYLTPESRGTLVGEVLPEDQERGGQRRSSVALRHSHTFSPQLTGYLNLQRASDDLYYVDLSNRLAVTSITNLPREGGLTWTGGWWTLSARTQKFQTLQDPRAPIVPPYARLPQITVSALRQDVQGVDASLQADYVAFSHPSLPSGHRATAYPSFTYPLHTAYATIVPKLGLHLTRYQLEGAPGAPEALSRALPILSVDGTVTFERDTSFRGTPLRQTLEPRLYYVYIPYRDQSAIPVFDTAVADFNLAQVFSENQFVGGDRINDANLLTAGVSSRFIDALDGRERLRLTLAQRFSFAEQRVTLPGSEAFTRNRSDVLTALSGRMSSAWYTDVAVKFDVSEFRPQRSTVALRYNPEPGRLAGAGYRFNRGTFEQADLFGQWNLGERWSAVGRFAYSLQDRRTTTTVAGVEYNSGCWVARFVLQQFATLTQDSVRAIFLQLELNGLSRIGSNPLEILRQNVLGYQRLNALPQSQLNEDYYPQQ